MGGQCSVRWATEEDLPGIKALQVESSMEVVPVEEQAHIKATEGYVSWLPSIDQLRKIMHREGIVCAVRDGTNDVIGYILAAPFDIVVEEFEVFDEVRRVLADVSFSGRPVLDGYHVGQAAVKRDYKGTGLPKRMSQLFRDRILASGFKHAFTGVSKNNPRSMAMCKGFGFIPVAEFDDWVSLACAIG